MSTQKALVTMLIFPVRILCAIYSRVMGATMIVQLDLFQTVQVIVFLAIGSKMESAIWDNDSTKGVAVDFSIASFLHAIWATANYSMFG